MSGPGWKRSLALPAAVRLLWHESEPHPRDIPLEELYADLCFPRPEGSLPYLVANMVMTQNGEAAVQGRASTIGTPVDGIVLTRVRSAADALLTGSGTVVAEDVTAALPASEAARRKGSGRPPSLLAAVLAGRLDWDDRVLSRRFFTDPGFQRLIITGEHAPPDAVRRLKARGLEVARVRSTPEGQPDPLAALELLAGRGARVVVSEGGPRLLGSLLRARLVREYFLTTSPFATGDPGAPRPVAGPVTRGDGPLLLERISRYEQEFRDPATGARLIESYDRFRVVYPEQALAGSGAK